MRARRFIVLVVIAAIASLGVTPAQLAAPSSLASIPSTIPMMRGINPAIGINLIEFMQEQSDTASDLMSKPTSLVNNDKGERR